MINIDYYTIHHLFNYWHLDTQIFHKIYNTPKNHMEILACVQSFESYCKDCVHVQDLPYLYYLHHEHSYNIDPTAQCRRQ
jgi:hypothetical protein